jgi:apolipoprotein N-acyltransferase
MRRSIVSSWTPFIGAIVAAVALALAFPKTNLTILAPLGAAGLYWTWYGLTPARAFQTGWLAGFVFFVISWSWVAESAGALIAPFGFILVLAPALYQGIFIGVAGMLSAVARKRASRALSPLCGAAAFAVCEWLRSIGPMGAPFGNLSYTQVGTPLAPFAAYIGSFGLTFVVCVIGAYIVYALREPLYRSTMHTIIIVGVSGIACTACAWLFWPARTLQVPTYPVVAAQGNINQNIKWTQKAFDLSVDTYETLTEQAATYDPAFVLWPETVIPANLNEMPRLQRRLSRLARSTHTSLIVGSKQTRKGNLYNALYFFRPDGTLDAVYRKRLLVPFAETLPAERILGAFPGANLVSRFSKGDASGIVDVDGARIAPLICWESAFGDLTQEDIQEGAQAFVIATDDAWFGTTAGPYQHAQIAQMRALETGAWIVRAGATGVSGIIAPNGRYTVQSKLNEMTIVHGMIGPRAGSFFGAIGSTPVVIGLMLLYASLVLRRETV